MAEIKKGNINEISKDFIPVEYSSSIKDPYFYRNKKDGKVKCRSLNANEIEILVKNNNFAEDWCEILVTDQFNPNLVKNCEFFGRVTIGRLTPEYLEFHDLKLPVGLYNSTIFCCDIGDNVVIKDVHYLSHYIVNNNCILFNIGEMITTNFAKFGNGVIKEGESEDVRIWLEICNENEGRKVLPFESMIPADAYIWSKFRDDKKLMQRLINITDRQYSTKRGYYGTIGNNSIIKNCRTIKDVKVGEYAYIKGANKLKNLTILSTKEESSQIGEGVELVNGIMGYGSKIFYGCKAVRFVTGRNTQLKYGARLINSVLGDNSTVSCCELLNNLIFPFHEQHHNTSFLIASTILGQSNIAAGATIGSNHNSRAADGEVFAGRGFWPGLSTNFKHNSKFSSFILVAKGSYNYEMNIKYPFSLVSIDRKEDIVTILPAYWFMYNMYAIERNKYKFKKRDQRKIKIQNIEYNSLAPDSVSEILYAINRIYYLIGHKFIENKKISNEEIISFGKKKIKEITDNNFYIYDDECVKKSITKIIKPVQAIEIYKDMCLYFSVMNILEYLKITENTPINIIIEDIRKLSNEILHVEWRNIGGQIISDYNLEEIINDIKSGLLNNWDQIHHKYDELWNNYPKQKVRFSLYILEFIYEKSIKEINEDDLTLIFKKAKQIALKILESTIASRKKDYKDKFRMMMYENEYEMNEVLGSFEDNNFINVFKNEINKYIKVIDNIL